MVSINRLCTQNVFSSGMRPTGALHLGHYHGVLKNWVKLQHEYPCLFFVADWHALTTQYDNPQGIEGRPGTWSSTGWRPVSIPTRRRCSSSPGARARRTAPADVDDDAARLAGARADLQGPAGKLAGKDLTTYGFLGYPLLMSADILIYRADKVPVGERPDSARRIHPRTRRRRFNHMYGREPGFEDKAREAVKKLGSKKARLYEELRVRFQQNGDKRPSSRPRPCSTKSSTCRRSTASACSAISKAPAR